MIKVADEELVTLYECRVILLMETGPQQNTYRQVKLNSEAFLKVSTTLSEISTPMPEQDGKKMFRIPLIEEPLITLSDNIKSIN